MGSERPACNLGMHGELFWSNLRTCCTIPGQHVATRCEGVIFLAMRANRLGSHGGRPSATPWGPDSSRVMHLEEGYMRVLGQGLEPAIGRLYHNFTGEGGMGGIWRPD
jgi:hypothetical protein